MKVLHELNQLEMGGAERVALGIARHDKENKHFVFTYKDGPMRKLFEAAGVEVIVEKEDGEIPELTVDVIHLHTGGGKSALANGVSGQIATVETVHSVVPSGVRDEWVHARAGVSDAVTKKNRKCRTIYNGVDLARLETDKEKDFFKKQLGIPEDSFVVGRLGRLGYDKCVEEWLAAAWNFQNRLTEVERSRVYFLICGAESEPGYWATIKVMIASLPLRNVVVVDATDQVMPVYNAMDLFMYPSPTEGFGLVYMEAMACGVPVLCWENQVTNELLMGHAHIVKPTVDNLIDGMELLHDNRAILDEYGSIGQELVLSDFTEERMSEAYRKLYAEVAEMVYGKAEAA